MKLSEAPESTSAKKESEYEEGRSNVTSSKREDLEFILARRNERSKGRSSQGVVGRSRSCELSESSTCFPRWSQ